MLIGSAHSGDCGTKYLWPVYYWGYERY